MSLNMLVADIHIPFILLYCCKKKCDFELFSKFSEQFETISDTKKNVSLNGVYHSSFIFDFRISLLAVS